MRMFVDPVAVYLYPQTVDFRMQFNGLALIVEQQLDVPLMSGALFVFTSTPGFLALAGRLNRNTSLFVMLDAMTGVISNQPHRL